MEGGGGVSSTLIELCYFSAIGICVLKTSTKTNANHPYWCDSERCYFYLATLRTDLNRVIYYTRYIILRWLILFEY